MHRQIAAVLHETLWTTDRNTTAEFLKLGHVMWIISTIWQVHIFVSPLRKAPHSKPVLYFLCLLRLRGKEKALLSFVYIVILGAIILVCNMWVCHRDEITIPCFSTNLSVQQQSKLLLGISCFGFNPRNVRKMLARYKTRTLNARLDSAKEF